MFLGGVLLELFSALQRVALVILSVLWQMFNAVFLSRSAIAKGSRLAVGCIGLWVSLWLCWYISRRIRPRADQRVSRRARLVVFLYRCLPVFFVLVIVSEAWLVDTFGGFFLSYQVESNFPGPVSWFFVFGGLCIALTGALMLADQEAATVRRLGTGKPGGDRARN